MKKANVIGAAVMTAAILISVPLGAGRSLRELREDSAGDYYSDDTGYAVYEGIETRLADAKNLLTLAEKYVDGNPELDPYIDELDYRISRLEDVTYGRDYVQEAETNELLGEAAQALYEELEKISLSEKDAGYPIQLIKNLESEQDKLERSSFNDDARAFNARLEKFPASLLSDLLGVEPLPVYGSGSDRTS